MGTIPFHVNQQVRLVQGLTGALRVPVGSVGVVVAVWPREVTVSFPHANAKVRLPFEALETFD